MASVKVVNKIKTKKVSQSLPIGTEQYYISPLRGNTGNNNFEEQSLIGPGCISTYWEENGIKKIIREFRDTNITSNYYILEIYDYNTSKIEEYVGYVNGVLSFKIKDEDSDIQGDNLFLNDEVYQTGDNSVLVEDEDAIMIAKQELYFQTSSEKILVSRKITTENYDSQGKIIISDNITNFL